VFRRARKGPVLANVTTADPEFPQLCADGGCPLPIYTISPYNPEDGVAVAALLESGLRASGATVTRTNAHALADAAASRSASSSSSPRAVSRSRGALGASPSRNASPRAASRSSARRRRFGDVAVRQVDYTEVRDDAGDVVAAVVDGDGAENVSHAMEHGFRYDENAGSRADASSVLDRARVWSDVDSALVELAFLLYNPPEPEIFEHRALLNLMETSGEVAAIDARGQ